MLLPQARNDDGWDDNMRLSETGRVKSSLGGKTTRLPSIPYPCGTGQDQINKPLFWAVLTGTEEASIKIVGIHKSLKKQTLGQWISGKGAIPAGWGSIRVKYFGALF